MNTTRIVMGIVAVSMLATGLAPSISAQSGGKAVFKPQAELTWTESGTRGVSFAVVDGDMKSGASHFYLKYGAGFVAPVHHHSPDHFVTTLTGNLVVIADGKEHALPPGSYFALTGKAQHGARCQGTADCVMFVDARGAWDVVMAEHPAGNH